MRFSTTVLAGLIAALSVQAQSDAGTSGSQTTAAIVSSTETVSSGSAVATSTSVLVVNTTTSVAPLVSGTQSASPAEASRDACIEDCPVDDNDCRAQCQTVANAVNPIADCQAGCVKGNGTAADDLAYKNCYQGCIDTATVSSVAAATTSAGEATETSEATATTDGGDAASTTSKAASKAASSAASGASAGATSATPGAAANVQATFSIAGILGVAALMLAL